MGQEGDWGQSHRKHAAQGGRLSATCADRRSRRRGKGLVPQNVGCGGTENGRQTSSVATRTWRTNNSHARLIACNNILTTLTQYPFINCLQYVISIYQPFNY